MPKFVAKLDKSAQEAVLENLQYGGPTPTPGIYRVKLKMVRIKVNKNGDDMLNPLLEIAETGTKKKYNGYGIWDNLNVTDQGAPFLNAFLDALGVRETFYKTGAVTDTQDPPNIVKIGSKKFDGGELILRVNTKNDTYDGNTKLAVTAYLKPADDDADDNGDEETAEEETAEEAAEEGTEAEGEAEAIDGYSEAELKELELADLVELAESWVDTAWEIKMPAKPTMTNMVKLMLASQAAAAEEPAEEAAEGEGDEAVEGDVYPTEEELTEMETADLKEYLTATVEDGGLGGTVPKPPLKKNLVAAAIAIINELQASAPPF